MTITKLPNNFPDLLRRQGLTVVEIDGWQGRGRPGVFRPVGTLWHHTGSPDKAGDLADDLSYAKWLANVGRSDLPAPLCQCSISFEGTWYICAAGRANHAGVARASGSVAGGDGNSLYVGVEMMNSGSQGFGKLQYESAVVGGAVLMGVLGTSHNAQRAHRETSVTGKWDPGMLDMDDFRDDLRVTWARMNKHEVEPKPRPRLEALLTETNQFVRRYEQALNKGGPELRRLLKDNQSTLADARQLSKKLTLLVGDK